MEALYVAAAFLSLVVLQQLPSRPPTNNRSPKSKSNQAGEKCRRRQKFQVNRARALDAKGTAGAWCAIGWYDNAMQGGSGLGRGVFTAAIKGTRCYRVAYVPGVTGSQCGAAPSSRTFPNLRRASDLRPRPTRSGSGLATHGFADGVSRYGDGVTIR